MEASSTTLNINGPQEPQAKPEKIAHSHGPNFGRFVEGCAACEAKGRPVRKAKVKAELQAVAPAAPQASQDTLSQLVQLLVQKEAKVAAKEENEAVRREAARQDMIRVTAEHEAMIAANQEACTHTKENGRSAIAQSQVHNDGKIHPFCQRCFKTWTPRRPHAEQMPTSVEV